MRRVPPCPCRWAKLEADEKSFTPEEKQYFDDQAQFAYRSFRDKVCTCCCSTQPQTPWVPSPTPVFSPTRACMQALCPSPQRCRDATVVTHGPKAVSSRQLPSVTAVVHVGHVLHAALKECQRVHQHDWRHRGRAGQAARAQAAESRGMAVEDMQERAQGRVWSGEDALQQRLIDAIGGVYRAVAIAKQAAGLGAPPPPSPAPPPVQAHATECMRTRRLLL